MNLVALLFVACGCISALLTEKQVERSFTNFRQEYAKIYSGEEYKQRLEIFRTNLAIITKHNAQTNRSFTMGVNQFTDRTPDEFRRYTTGVLRQDSPLVPVSPLQRLGGLGDSIPDIDWVAKGAVTPAKDQGQCGSCWAFSSTGALEAAHFLATGNLVSLSEQQLMDCANSTYGNQGCVGGRVDGSYAYTKKEGLCGEDDYAPYAAVVGECRADNCTSLITGPSSVSRSSAYNEDSLGRALAVQPVNLVIEADQHCFQYYESGVLDYNTCPCGSNGNLDHAVLLVGAGTTPDGVDYWKVKNSWGGKWGEDGFIRLQRGVGNQGAGMCLVTVSAEYPLHVGGR